MFSKIKWHTNVWITFIPINIVFDLQQDSYVLCTNLHVVRTFSENLLT